ncbi:MAG: hypothetical protein LBE98_00545 [Puniceicoccales bacterium]|jgi:hypothetical protein|nr:hypothetical protein [Puniceicoccales bacterium]
MLCAIGQRREVGVDVPHVIATVSAAEMEGIPSIATEMLEGETLRHNVNEHSIDFFNNEFVRWETWIQIQDVLTGQIDRHWSNIIVTKDGPIGIDHDLSFPTNTPQNCCCIPPVIDREMYSVIMAINLSRLQAMYQECGLTRPEVSAAMARAEGLQARAQELMDQDLVIEPDQWEASPLMRTHCNPQNFYAAQNWGGK